MSRSFYPPLKVTTLGGVTGPPKEISRTGGRMATYPLRVIKKQVETEDAVSLFFDVPKDLKTTFDYRPGQFLTLEMTIGNEVIARQYSLSSTPGVDGDLRITVKRIAGGCVSTRLVDEITVGDLVDIHPPRGRFFKEPDQPSHFVMIAAGSGIAPILPIARWLLEESDDHKVTILYGNRSSASVILWDELNQLEKQYGERCFIDHVMSRPDEVWSGATGRIDRPYIRQRFQVGWGDQIKGLPMVFYLCGPEGFMDAAESALMESGASLKTIHKESFDLILEEDGDEPGLIVKGAASPGEDGKTKTITVVVGGQEYEADWQQGEDVLSSLLRANADVPFSCQEGTCSSCISKIIDGRLEVRPGVLKTLRQDDLDEGLTLACLSIPKTKHVRIDFDEL